MMKDEQLMSIEKLRECLKMLIRKSDITKNLKSQVLCNALFEKCNEKCYTLVKGLGEPMYRYKGNEV